VCDASSLRLILGDSISHTGTSSSFPAVNADSCPHFSCSVISVSQKRVRIRKTAILLDEHLDTFSDSVLAPLHTAA
jgi:hypothetical protein